VPAAAAITLGDLSASTEFQAVPFMPAFVLPQLLLCEQMAGALDALAGALPRTYAFDALDRVSTQPAGRAA
jgi:ABC-2 type transport system permease protein